MPRSIVRVASSQPLSRRRSMMPGEGLGRVLGGHVHENYTRLVIPPQCIIAFRAVLAEETSAYLTTGPARPPVGRLSCGQPHCPGAP